MIAIVAALAGVGAVRAQTGKAETLNKPAMHGTMTQGKYVALAADCMSCHTAPGGAPFAGGDALKSPFGTLYGPNITQDVATGIGSWSKSDFERALRLGIRKDGAYLYPAMPYGSYTKMSASDMNALWVYIKSLPAVSHTVPPNTLPFPLTIRSGMAVWQSLYFKPGLFVPVAGKDLTWNRGAYLVQALGHCADCHTPRNLAQGLETQHQLTGAQIEGWYAPDISNDPLSKVTSWKTQDLAKYLQTGLAPGNVKVIGPMQEVVHDSLSHLARQDLIAISVYLKDQDDGATAHGVSKVKWPTERLAAGKTLYEDNCSSCHQRNGKGIPGSAPALAGNDAVTAGEPYNIIMSMLEGFPPQGTWGAMGSFAKTLNDEQITDIANYIRTAWGNDAPPNATPWSVGNWRRNATANDESKALLCPDLSQDLMAPALRIDPALLKQSANDGTAMRKVVGEFVAARPKSSTAQIIEALSTAYCRSVSNDPITQPLMSARIADFAQHVAVAVSAPDRTT